MSGGYRARRWSLRSPLNLDMQICDLEERPGPEMRLAVSYW
jgi:hypothetical protein